MSATNTGDHAVREYLLFLENPDHLVDRDQVQKLQERVDASTDPLERLVALAEFERARHPIEDRYRQAFIENAQTWAESNDVPPTAFEQLGVPRDVLQAAGLMSGKPTKQLSASRKPSTSAEDLKGVIRKMPKRFTARDVVAAAGGGSPMTVRKALSESVDETTIRRVGPDPDWSGRGRAPVLYEPAK